MKPPYEITSTILKSVASISELLGKVNANFLDVPNPQLRKINKIQTIHASLGIEGNTLSEAQITAIIENKHVIGPEKDILEVRNAIEVYENLEKFTFHSQKSFLLAHKMLMKNLISDAGNWRKKGVGIVKGNKVEHLAPPAENLQFLMNDLFLFLKKEEELILIKSCVFHYELEFIHPFMDGNGRMGRLWQTVILMSQYPVFSYLPLETLISNSQDEYYKALGASDKLGKSTPFIEYMLGIIEQALASLLKRSNRSLTDVQRLEYFVQQSKKKFTRKDYMEIFRDISTSTASRDLKTGVEKGLFEKIGDKNSTEYMVIRKPVY